MKWILAAVAGFTVFLMVAPTDAHDVITTSITWNREISRIFTARCVSCHRDGGSAFSLATYKDAYPWKTAIREEVLERRMPPWGAVKGFGNFRNDQALTPEHLEIITSWTEGGAPEGEPKDLPSPPSPEDVKKESGWGVNDASYKHPAGELLISGDFALTKPFRLDGVWPQEVPKDADFQIVAELPDGTIEPLVWLINYKTEFGHPFLLRTPLDLPARTVIRGLPDGSSVFLLPAPTSSSLDGASALTDKPLQK
jgi:hypothetical protein